MPKAIPDQVIVHRIEFQESERAMLQDLTTVWSFNRVMEPLVRLVNDNTTILLILTALGGWLGFKYIPPALEDAYAQVIEFQNQLDAAVQEGTLIRERWDFVTTSWTRGIWGFADLVEAYYGTNVPDFGAGYEPGQPAPGSGGGGGF